MITNLHTDGIRGTLHHSNNGVALCRTGIKLSDYVFAKLDADNNATYNSGSNANHAVCKNCAKKFRLVK
jgi:hypothetical protein